MINCKIKDLSGPTLPYLFRRTRKKSVLICSTLNLNFLVRHKMTFKKRYFFILFSPNDS